MSNSGEPRRERLSRFNPSCPHQIQHQFRLNAPQFGCFAWVDFSLARIYSPVSTERALQLLPIECALPLLRSELRLLRPGDPAMNDTVPGAIRDS